MRNIVDLFVEDCPVAFDEEAIAYSEPMKSDLVSWWQEAPQGDWMIWCAGQLGSDLHELIFASCLCVRTALKYLPDGENRPKNAIELAEGWVQGGISSADCIRASDIIDECMSDLGKMCGSINTIAAMSAAGACGALVDAAGHCENRVLSVIHATRSLGRAAGAGRYPGGLEVMKSQLGYFADIVRQNVKTPVIE